MGEIRSALPLVAQGHQLIASLAQQVVPTTFSIRVTLRATLKAVRTKPTTHFTITRPLTMYHNISHRQQEDMLATARRVSLLALFFTSISLTFGQEEQQPAALISVLKNVVDEAAIEGKPFPLEYTIRNLGTLPARVIIREGANLAGLSISKSSGNGTIIMNNVLPQSTTTARLVIVAETERVIPASRADVEYSYMASTGEEITRKGHSSASKPIVVYNYDEYRKTFKDYTREYTLFSLGTAIPVLLPLGVWLVLSASAADTTKSKRK